MTSKPSNHGVVEATVDGISYAGTFRAEGNRLTVTYRDAVATVEMTNAKSHWELLAKYALVQLIRAEHLSRNP